MKRVLLLTVGLMMVLAASAFAQSETALQVIWMPMTVEDDFPDTTAWMGVDKDGSQLAACKVQIEFRGEQVEALGKIGPGVIKWGCLYEFDGKSGQAKEYEIMVYGIWAKVGGAFPKSTIWAAKDVGGDPLTICKTQIESEGKKVDILGKTGNHLRGQCLYEFDGKMGQVGPGKYVVLTATGK